MILHNVKVYPSKIHLPKKNQLAWKIAEIASDNAKLNKDAIAAKAAEIPIILLKYGYTEKRSDEIYHNHIIKDFVGIEKIVSKYL